MKLPRKRLSKNLLRQLNAFYGGRRCVITDSPNNTDWHHLDDNPSNSIFPNLIPLSRDYNSTLELYRRYQQSISVWKGTHPLLTPQFLLIYSNYHFRAGQVQLAYGCSRLAGWLIKLYPALHSPEIDIFDCILQALSCARHAASPVLILDIINRDVISILQKRKASLYNRIRLEQEFASLFQEYGLMARASELFEQTRLTIKLLPPDQRISCEGKDPKAEVFNKHCQKLRSCQCREHVKRGRCTSSKIRFQHLCRCQ